MKRTLKRESKVLEIVRREAIGAGGSSLVRGCSVVPACREDRSGGECSRASALCSFWRKPCIQSRRRASIGFMFICVWLTGAGDQRAWRAGFTAVSRRCDPAYLPSQGPRNQLTHARKGEAVRHRGGHARGDREPMPVCMPVAPWRASISGGLVMLAERR